MPDSIYCLHCSGELVSSTFRGLDFYEPDYNPFDDQVTLRHKTTGYAACMVTRFAEPRPEIVCLCGSTRFSTHFREANYNLTLQGKIVLSIGCDTKSDIGLCIQEDQKIALDALHKYKIRIADRVLVLNIDGYIGDSTKSEIEYAESLGKSISYLVDMETENA